MPAIDHYDTLVVGSGEAGKYLAWDAVEGRQSYGVDRTAHGGRLVPERRMSSEQEHHPQCKNGIHRRTRLRVRPRGQFDRDEHAERSAAEADDGRKISSRCI